MLLVDSIVLIPTTESIGVFQGRGRPEEMRNEYDRLAKGTRVGGENEADGMGGEDDVYEGEGMEGRRRIEGLEGGKEGDGRTDGRMDTRVNGM